MKAFKLGKMTFSSLFKKPETLLYPHEKKQPHAGLKGHIVLDTSTCILCGICEKACNTNCISVSRKDSTWKFNPFQCVQCGYCINSCPKKSLSMSPEYWPANKKIDEVSYRVEPKSPKASKATASKDGAASSKEGVEASAKAVPAKAALKKTSAQTGDSQSSHDATSGSFKDSELAGLIADMPDAKARIVSDSLKDMNA